MAILVLLIIVYLVLSNKQKIINFFHKVKKLDRSDIERYKENIKNIKKKDILAGIKKFPSLVIEAIGDFLMVLERNTIGRAFPGRKEHRKAFSPFMFTGILIVVEVIVLGGKYQKISAAEDVMSKQWEKVGTALGNGCLKSEGEAITFNNGELPRLDIKFFPSKSTEAKYKLCREKSGATEIKNNGEVVMAAAKYNKSVNKYNDEIKGFLGNFVSKMFGKIEAVSFLVEEAGVSAPAAPVVLK